MNTIPQNTGHSVFIDQFGRAKRKLRISVTDRCNFNCIYCMPEHPEWMSKQNLLSFEALYQFCEFMVDHGVEQIRITGGEPLMRLGVVQFVGDLQKLKSKGLKRISMTSNGHYLQHYAEQLKQAGLDDLNISLDSLDPEQFQRLTAKQIQPVLEGIAAAQRAGLSLKINAVLIKAVNEDQILALAHWSIQQKLILRFIEYMPMDGNARWTKQDVVTEQDILDKLKQEFTVGIQSGQGSEPARQYLINAHPIGIISTISHSFCASCDRIRLTAQGDMYNCLFSSHSLALAEQIKALADSASVHTSSAHSASVHSSMPATVRLQQCISEYIWHKKQGFHAIYPELIADPASRRISMHMIGG